MASPQEDDRNSKENLSDLTVSSRSVSWSVDASHPPGRDGVQATAPKQILGTWASTASACQLAGTGNVAVHSERDIHVGQNVKVGYNYTTINRNKADQIVSCDKFIGHQYLSQTYTGEAPLFNCIRDQTKADLMYSLRLFVETQSFHQAVDAVSEKGFVLISGPPGSGKAMLARAVLHHYESQGYVPLILHNIREWRQYVGSDHQLVILLENVFGELFFDYATFQEGARYFRTMLQFAATRTCLIVFTAYPHIVQEMKDCKVKDNIFRVIPWVNLHQTILTVEEKKEMIRKHGVAADTAEREDICEDIMTRDVSGPVFPWCLRRFRKTVFKADDGISIFNKPALSYTSLLSRGLTHETHGCCLAATLLHVVKAGQELGNGMDLLQDNLKQFAFTVCGVQCVAALMRKLPQLFGLSEEQCCSDKQIHMAAGFALASSNFSDTFLKCCDIKFLMEYVGKDLLEKRSRQNYESFHRRIYDEIMKGKLQEISQHQQLQNEDYLNDFAQFCSSESLPLHNLFMVTDCEHKEPLLYWSAFCSSSVLTAWCAAQMLASGTEEESVSVCLQRVLLVSILSGDDPSCDKVRNIVSALRKLPVEPVPSKKMIFPYPKKIRDLERKCEHLKKHGSFHLYFFLKDDYLPCSEVHVFLNEVDGYFRLEMSEFHWTLVLRRVQADCMMGVHKPDAEGNTYLHLAAAFGNPEAVKFALKRGASIMARNKDGSTPPDLARKRLRNTLNKVTDNGLCHACQHGDLTLVKKLLCLSSTVSCISPAGETPLHSACKAGQISIASLLLDLGADINAKMRDRFTPLHVACHSGHRETTHLLLKRRADPNIADAEGRRPLHVATLLNHRYIILLLLHFGANIDAKRSDGCTPLHVACGRGNIFTVKQLLEENAKLNVKNRRGQTPLHTAVYDDNIDVMRMLCICGASLTVEDKCGRTPVTLASSLHKGRVYALLLELKARGRDVHPEFSFPNTDETGTSTVCPLQTNENQFSSSGEREDFHGDADLGNAAASFQTSARRSDPVGSTVTGISEMFETDTLGITPQIFATDSARARRRDRRQWVRELRKHCSSLKRGIRLCWVLLTSPNSVCPLQVCCHP